MKTGDGAWLHEPAPSCGAAPLRCRATAWAARRSGQHGRTAQPRTHYSQRLPDRLDPRFKDF